MKKSNRNLITLLSLLSLSIIAFGQKHTDCYKEIKNNSWNYSICIDTIMGVDMTNNSKLIIKQYGPNSRLELSVKMKYNYDNNTPKELLKNRLKDRVIEGLTLITQKDSILITDNNNYYYISQSVFVNDKNELWILSTAIGLYKSQYYIFETLGINDIKTSMQFLCKVLNRSDFFGEPILKNDKKLKADFLEKLTTSITDKDELSKIIITKDLMLSFVPKVEQISASEVQALETMISDWNQSAHKYVEHMKKFNSVTIKDHNFESDYSIDIVFHKGLVSFVCDGADVKYKLMSIEINNKLYLCRIILD